MQEVAEEFPAMSPIQIFPRYKLVLTYDIQPGVLNSYQHFILHELLPTMQDLGVYMMAVWQTAYGSHPSRQVEFVAETLEEVQAALEDDRWLLLEGELQNFVHNYNRQIIHYRHGFQLVAQPSS